MRDQLWAEAVVQYREGKPWHLDTKVLNNIAEEEQAERYHHDAWEKPVAEYIEKQKDVSIGEILKDALFITTDKWNQQDQNRVARILRLFKWWKKQVRIPGTAQREKRYFPPLPQTEELESGDF